jgi:branched-chain amino acid transport system permease protein
MQVLLDQITNGLTRGAEYALVAAGLALIFGVVQIVNFAHGEFYMVGAYFLFVAQAVMGLPYALGALTAILAMTIFGGVFYVLVIERIIGKGWQTQLVATLAASVLLVNVAIVLAGSVPQTVVSPLSDAILSIGTVHFSAQRLLVLVLAIIAFAALYVFLRFTKVGKAMRAISQNRDAAVVVGIPVNRMALAAVIVGSALAGVAAVTIPPLSNVSPTMGSIVTLKAFAAVVMGGFGNVSGAVVSALILGIVEALGVGFISSEYGDAIVFGAMILVLLVRPYGLFGRPLRS